MRVRDERGGVRFTPRRVFLKICRTLSTLLACGHMLISNRWSREPLIGDADVDVSLTTYGVRLKSVAYSIESIGRGSVRPRMVVLWLDEPFEHATLPRNLKRLIDRGLTISRTDDWGPHKKYFPYVQSQVDFDRPLVTADDDVIYPKNWLARLIETHIHSDPTAVICYRAHIFTMDGEVPAPYLNWSPCSNANSLITNFATGVSGILYPPVFLQSLKTAGNDFVHKCPRADDVWLHYNAVRSGTKVRQVSDVAQDFNIWPGSQSISLDKKNVLGNGNDRQIMATYGPSELRALHNA